MTRFAPFEARPMLAVAVSGGRDSMALALLANDWARARAGEVLGLIVDHRLRPEAAAEAARRQRAVRARHRRRDPGLERRQAGEPSQEIARMARYRLLFDAWPPLESCICSSPPCRDQSETIVMRAARASGPMVWPAWQRWSSIRRRACCGHCWRCPRERLTATLAARGVAWIDDPSNEDRRFERVRVRQEARGQLRRAFGGPAARDRQVAEAAVEALELTRPASPWINLSCRP
jgi:tRNA(Ile)-lysidine synthase